MRAQLTLLLLILAPVLSTAETLTLETITVKGTKEEKSYEDDPTSVSILKENDLPATGRTNGLEAINGVPNVEVNKNGESFSIRGVSNTGVTGYQKDNLSSVVIDDVFQTDLAIQSGAFDLWDMERVEILKGAQSTNQGVNSLAGAILLNHKLPSFSSEGAAKLGGGNHGSRDVGVVTNHVLNPEKLAVRIAYDKDMTDGYIRNLKTDNDRWGGWDRDRLGLNFLYRASETSTLNVGLKYHRSEQGGTYTQGSDAFRYEVNEDRDSVTKTSNSQLKASYANTLSDNLTNTTIFAASLSDQNQESDADGTPNPTAGVRYETHRDHYFSVENRLLLKTANLENLFGLHAHDFLLTDDYDFNMLYPVGAASTPLAIRQGVDRTRKAYAAFDSFTYRFDENHSLLLGARAEYVDSNYGTTVFGRRLQSTGNAGVDANLDSYLARVSGTYEGSRFNFVVLPKIGYLFETGPHHAGLTFTRGYRTAGVSINRSQAKAVEYDPEFTDNYEASYRYAGETFRFGSNVFYVDWSDQQVQVQLSTNDFFNSQVENAAKSRLYGAEVEGQAKIDPRQTLTLGVGYTDTAFKDFTANGTDYSGKQFPYASHWTGRLSHEWKPGDDWTVLSVARYVSESWANVENSRRADPQFYLDLNAKYVLGAAWVLEGYVNNVLDGQYRIFDGTPTSTTSPYQASYHQVSTPREFGARATYYW